MKYHDLWERKEKNFRRIDPDKAAVVFLDGQGVTGNHKKYDLMGKDPVYRALADAAWKVAGKTGIPCMIHAAVDECSIVFPDTPALMARYRMGNCADYILSLYTQDFLKEFWQRFPDVRLKSTLFPLPEEDVERYLAWRQESGHTVALFWLAKECLPSEKYKNLPFSPGPVTELLKKEGLYQKVKENRPFFYGVRREYVPDRSMERFSDAFVGKKA